MRSMSIDARPGSAETAVAVTAEAGSGALLPPSSRAAALGAAFAYAAVPFQGRTWVVVAAPALALASLALHRRGDTAGRNATLAVALTLATTLLPVPGVWTWPAPALLVAAAALRPRWRGPGGLVPWLRSGTLRGTDLAWVAAVVAASAGALVVWTAIRRPDVADLTRALPPFAPWLLLAGGTAWAALNAFGEEAIFRGALLSALERAVGGRAALVVQAIVFGLIHWRGFPRGPDGAALAAVYGLMLGGLRARTGGLLAPWLAHVFADVVVLALLLAAR